MSDTLLTPNDLAAYFKVPVASVYAWNSRGTGPARIGVGKHVRYRRADVEAWLDGQVIKSSEGRA